LDPAGSVDLAALLAHGGDAAADQAARAHFARNIRPQLAALTDEGSRRRVGLRLWLEYCRANAKLTSGRLFGQALSLAGWALFVLMGLAGMGLVTGLLLGPRQAVHVIIFFGATLVVPWLLYGGGMLLRTFGRRRGRLALVVRMVLQLQQRKQPARVSIAALLNDLAELHAPRRALSATFAGLWQRGAVGFNLGLIVAFIGCLLLFDVRFYWETTPRIGMESLLASIIWLVALPWGWLWPQAVPDAEVIAATRAVAGSLPQANASIWWRFLLLALLVWGLLPRLLLAAYYRLVAHRALAHLTFQAPRQRALWRRLNSIERGEVAAGPTDGVLVLDVGGHGVDGAAVRGFLLRRLRVNPLTTRAIAVLDDAHEAQAEQALAAGPAGVVLLVEGWTLSPRQVQVLHARLRRLLGARVPMTWLVFALAAGQPVAPADADLQRWTRQIDSLRDPATEVAAYDG